MIKEYFTKILFIGCSVNAPIILKQSLKVSCIAGTPGVSIKVKPIPDLDSDYVISLVGSRTFFYFNSHILLNIVVFPLLGDPIKTHFEFIFIKNFNI